MIKFFGGTNGKGCRDKDPYEGEDGGGSKR